MTNTFKMIKIAGVFTAVAFAGAVPWLRPSH